jgi:hypothetical protein
VTGFDDGSDEPPSEEPLEAALSLELPQALSKTRHRTKTIAPANPFFQDFMCVFPPYVLVVRPDDRPCGQG